MTITVTQALFWVLALTAVVGAAVVVFAREMMRMALGLGAFLVAAAGLFLYYGAGFLAAAQVFVYVGGVLVLLLFAMMLLRRSVDGIPRLSTRHDVVSALLCIMFGGAAGWLLLRDATTEVFVGTSPGLAESLLGPMLPHFELLGVLLLAALVAVVAIMGGERS